MKTTFKFIIVAMAAIAVFSSCQKELANDTANKTTDGVRTISVQFDNSTKATLDNFAPKFADNDKIRVSNSERSEECQVSVDAGDNATFTTTLSGDLIAIYPADAAVLGTDAGQPIEEPFFKVSASQDGTMEKAIIAKADIADGCSSATFTGQTAVFVITPPTGATSFTITSLKPVVGGIARTGTAREINTEGDDKCVITVDNNELTTFYVSLVPGVNLTDLSFDAGANYGMKGIPMKDIETQATELSKLAAELNTTLSNTIYEIGNSNNTWHPYVEITMIVRNEQKTYKWATMNIGAETPGEYGQYFMWGYTKGHYPNDTSPQFSGLDFAEGERGDNNYGFDWVNYIKFTSKTYKHTFPGQQRKVFTKYVANKDIGEYGDNCSDNKTTLDLNDDAANANWGGSWRMPSEDEFSGLRDQGNDESGWYVGTSEEMKIFLPYAGYSSPNDGIILVSGSEADYWSSSLNVDSDSNHSTNKARALILRSTYYQTDKNWRCCGLPVRPVSD